MAASSKVTAARAAPDIIDLNFGCPVKKVVKKNGGSALLANLPLMDEIVRAVVAAVEVPVTAEACWRVLPDVVRALEEPVAGPGSLAQYVVAQRAAEPRTDQTPCAA